MDRDKVVRDARILIRHLRRKFPDWTERSGDCLFLSACMAASIESHGCRAIIQAGTCFWPRLTDEQAALESDPIVSFGYQWEPSSWETHCYLMNRQLPEMHVWVFMPDTSEIVDIASGEWPAQCKKIMNLDWPGTKPPDYFWCAPGPCWPAGVSYIADKMAVALANTLLRGLVSSCRKI